MPPVCVIFLSLSKIPMNIVLKKNEEHDLQ